MLEKYFDFAVEEEKIYNEHETAGYYHAGAGNRKKDAKFSIMIPPPNVTGSLHMGHALNNTLQDILIRYKRMQGYNVLWQVGSDHAGIATQALVEKQMDTEGKKRTDIGREAFIDRIWEWKAHSGGTIMKQLRRLGASCDFSRERFTMDEGLCNAVRKVFVTLYNEGLIYRDNRLVNWDCALQTAVADIEAIPTDTKGNLYHLRYYLLDREHEDEFVVVATTRPETMFGDMAVAVNPNDERYKKFIGRKVILPFTGRNIPIVADDYADMETGTGAVKITPAHDFNDFEVGKRHNLPILNILHADGRLNENVPEEYQGLDRLEARKKLVAHLQLREILVEIEPHQHKVPHGERSGTVIEPFLTEQWYVDAHTLAQPALEVVRSGEIKFIPQNWEKTYYSWLDNIQPWCISRQLWWGHQIPAWYAEDGTVFVAESEEEAYAQARAKLGNNVKLTQDEDVLDTWFSSALWPFSTLGWPKNTPELETYYPTDVLVTGFDIIFFWVARMIMMGKHFTKKIPFKDIYMHALVRDEKGQKMSKSKGNVIDPLSLVEQYGADALRFTLCAMAAQGRDIKLATSRVEGYRNFGTKIWNAARFAQMNECIYDEGFDISSVKLPLSDWVLDKLKKSSKNYDEALVGYKFNEVADGLYHFIWGDVCDRFIEMAKPFFNSENAEQKREIQCVTAYVLKNIYILLHPIMPFISQALYGQTVDDKTPLCHVEWINLDSLDVNQESVENIQLIVELIEEIRSLRSSINVPASSKIDVYFSEYPDEMVSTLEGAKDILIKMARLNNIHFQRGFASKGTAGFALKGLVALFPLADVIDTQKERERLSKELEKVQKEIDSTNARLANENFIAKASEEVIDEIRQRVIEKQEVFDKTKKILDFL